MRIAQVSPLYESVPPRRYGGTERIVSYLTEELVKMGHEVTLFASGDSHTQARLVSPCTRGLRLDGKYRDYLVHHIVMLEQYFRVVESFDIAHFHIDYLHYPLSSRHAVAHLTTLHGRLDLPELKTLYSVFPSIPVVSISNAQRKPLPFLNWQGTVYHGLPSDMYIPQTEHGRYLAFLGRISPEKRPDLAVEIARRFGMELKIAAKVDPADLKYFQQVIRPLIDDSLIKFVGEIDEKEKGHFLGNAYALLFPIDWPEPFGMVMIEAMACGTPVIAFRRGSVPEVMTDGMTGFVVHTLEEAVEALGRVSLLNRHTIRRVFEERFTSRRMAEEYLAIYQQMVEDRTLSLTG